MSGRAVTAPIFSDSPPSNLPGSWEFVPRDKGDGTGAAGRAVLGRWHWVILILLCIGGGVLHFAWLDRPTIWGDEASTYVRVMGSYDDLLKEMKRTRFMPLNYQAIWAVGNPDAFIKLIQGDISGFVAQQAIKTGQQRLTPFWLRLVAAISGTLMTPAIYFLARQLLNRRAALLSAAFTACSAYIFSYSRDAKMYMPFFLALTVNMACFFWWMRTRSSLAWLGWIASGLATLGLHISGLGVIALQPIYLLTQRRPHWRQGLLFVLGLIIIFAGPAGYYAFFNPFGQKIEEKGWSYTGIEWVTRRNKQHSAIEQTVDSLSAYLLAWDFIPEGNVRQMTPSRVTAATAGFGLVLGLCLLGALPWSKKLRGDRFDDPPQEPWWRKVLWLGLWIVVPLYAVYCLSFPREEVVSPIAWLSRLGGWLVSPWRVSDNVSDSGMTVIGALLASRAFLLVGGMVLIAALGLLGRIIPRLLAGIALFSVLILTIILAVDESGFLPLYDPQTPQQANLGHGIYLAALMLTVALLWVFCGDNSRERVRKFALVALIGAALWGACYIIFVSVKPMDGSVWMPRYLAFIWPAVVLALSALLVRIPTRPLRWGAIGLVLLMNLGQAYGRIFIGNEPPVDRVVSDILADRSDPMTLTFTPPLRTHSADKTMAVNYLGAAPGGGMVWDWVGRYYFAHQSDQPVSVQRFGRWRPWEQEKLREDASPAAVKAALKKQPQAQRIIVWQQYPDETSARSAADPLAEALGGRWAYAGQTIYNVRFYWSWADLYTYSRREYQLAGGS
ncbi:MAG: glycosyltransferase family 39 protein [Phycisphaerales bacterium]|nr:glycosyltransferase family 39 protein [Phycisphaerales bacterium]